MLCAVYTSPQELVRYSILWSSPLNRKGATTLMATKKKAAKKAAKKGGAKKAAKKSAKKR